MSLFRKSRKQFFRGVVLVSSDVDALVATPRNRYVSTDRTVPYPDIFPPKGRTFRRGKLSDFVLDEAEALLPGARFVNSTNTTPMAQLFRGRATRRWLSNDEVAVPSLIAGRRIAANRQVITWHPHSLNARRKAMVRWNSVGAHYGSLSIRPARYGQVEIRPSRFGSVRQAPSA